jgi:hypothetical protein
VSEITIPSPGEIQQRESKYYYRSGNYHIVRSGDNFTVKSFSVKNSKCKHSEHFLGKNYPPSFGGLEDAIKDCVCMAAKSLKRNSGELIYESNQDIKRPPRTIQQVEWVDDDEATQVEIEFEYLQDPEES